MTGRSPILPSPGHRPGPENHDACGCSLLGFRPGVRHGVLSQTCGEPDSRLPGSNSSSCFSLRVRRRVVATVSSSYSDDQCACRSRPPGTGRSSGCRRAGRSVPIPERALRSRRLLPTMSWLGGDSESRAVRVTATPGRQARPLRAATHSRQNKSVARSRLVARIC